MPTPAEKRKRDQLGMPSGTANARLKVMLMFKLAKLLNMTICVRCGMEIESIKDFSIDHIIPWLDNDVALFWDLDNVAFAHKVCNCKAARRGAKCHRGDVTLTPTKVKAIRKESDDGMSARKLAAKYDVARNTIRAALSRSTWADVE